MTQYAHTSDGVAFSVVDFPGLAQPPVTRSPINFVTGSQVYTPEQVAGFVAQEVPAPAWGMYNYAPGTEQPPGGRPLTYYIVGETFALVGSLGDPAALIQGTRTYTEIPIAELYDAKRGEIANQDQSVRYNAVDTVLAVNWWLIVTQDARFELDGIQGNWLQRQIDGQGFPGGINAPWVGIYNASTQDSRRVQVPGADAIERADNWNTLYLEKTLHDQATGNATETSRDTLDAENAAAEQALIDAEGDTTDPAYIAAWEVVADHDAADPAWGYPPTITLQL